MSYDDQYDAPLSGVERARIEALNLTGRDRMHDSVELWVDEARTVERFIIGQRSTGVQERIDEAYALAEKLLSSSDEARDGDQYRLLVPLDRMQELVRKLSGLAEMPF